MRITANYPRSTHHASQHSAGAYDGNTSSQQYLLQAERSSRNHRLYRCYAEKIVGDNADAIAITLDTLFQKPKNESFSSQEIPLKIPPLMGVEMVKF
jgi:hypothetical protein